MTVTRPRILFLPRWYPDRYDPMPGLFFKRLAGAVSEYCDVAVLYVHQDVNCRDTYEIDRSREGQVTIVRVYYRSASGRKPVILFGTMINIFRFFRAQWLGFKELNDFHPDLVHVHVLTRTGVVALFYKIAKRIPYIVSEHWSRYFPENGNYKGFLRKMLTRLVVRRSTGLILVSEKLKAAMLGHGLKNMNCWILPNPVDMELFRPEEHRQHDPEKRIIHVSCFDDRSKNILGFLRVIRNLSLKRDDFQVQLIGEGPDLARCRQAAAEMGLSPGTISFPGLKENRELASLMANADFLVLSSNYETFGTVVIESLACGTPVVATDVGVVNDVISRSNGIIVKTGDDKALEEGINEMLGKCSGFDPAQVRETVLGRYDESTISKRLFEIYAGLLNPDKH